VNSAESHRTLSYCLAALMLMAVIAAHLLKPHLYDSRAAENLASAVPDHFGDWHAIATPIAIVDPTRDKDAKASQPILYDDILMRGYENSQGAVVLLALAYGKQQRQEFKIHRPELCYIAQGFRLVRMEPIRFPILGVNQQLVSGSRMLVQSQERAEMVSYWIRIGDIYSESAWVTRSYLLKEGMKGRIRDGILVRVSQILPAAEDATQQKYQLQEEFLAELIRYSPTTANLLIG
jgi:EpsI family protein